MTTTRFLIALGMLAGLAGCAYEGPAGEGSAVRAALASQMLPPQPRPQPRADTGVDAAAAVSAYSNYKQSYAHPTPQNDSGLIRK